MITYATEFPIDSKNSISDVLKLAREWIAGSPHSRIPKDELRDIPADSLVEYAKNGESLTVGAARSGDIAIGGLRWAQIEAHSMEWVTTVVAYKTPAEHLLSIRVSCEALRAAVRLPTPKKPYIIKQALVALGGGMDGSIPVADKPFALNEDEVEIAAELILGNGGNRLPIVYISAKYDGTYMVEPRHMCRLVSGTAHVVVEPSRKFAFKLKSLVDGRNAYGGTVGIYWPETNTRRSYFLGGSIENAEQLQTEIAKDIRIALANRRQRTLCSWFHLREVISKNRIERLKQEGSTELNEYIEAFDAELKEKDERLQEAEHEIARLNAEARRYADKGQRDAGGMLVTGVEQDFYRDEIRDIVVQALKDALRNVKAKSRRQHVLSDLLDHNEISGEGARMAEEIKSVFKSYVTMDAKKRGALVAMGFEISEDGKHYKAVFQGDGRYTFAISKTSSDHRAGKNHASDINSQLF